MSNKFSAFQHTPEDSHQAWEQSMLRQIETLRADLRRLAQQQTPERLAHLCGGQAFGGQIELRYWYQAVRVDWQTLEWSDQLSGAALPVYDQALLLYYLHTANGTSLADRWVSFRELPGGGFYHQAFQGYSGDLVAKAFSSTPENYLAACQKAGGNALTSLGEYTFAFEPLPKIHLAAVLWPGDEDFPTRAGILFDAASINYLPIDGLALIGSKLARRILRA